MEIAASILIAGLVVGAALYFALRTRATGDSATHEAESRRALEQENRFRKLMAELTAQQREELTRYNEEQLKTATARGEEQLKARQKEIDSGLEGIRKELLQVREFVTKTDSEQNKSIANVTAVTREMKAVTEALRQDTTKLNETLAGNQSRGQWGERMAEDVLRVAGFIEGINYRKQTETADRSGRPDFTFLLPEDRVLHMDVKFPLPSYQRYLEAENDDERDRRGKDFLRDVKQRITEVTNRNYIDPEAGTLDYTLVFIPNEQVYGFIQEQDQSLINYALENRVVICSPLTLFAVLAVIRQSMENFRLAKRTDEILGVLTTFDKQWGMYKGQIDKLGNAIASVNRNYDELHGKRTRALDRQLKRIDEIRSKGGALEADEADALPMGEPIDVEAELGELSERPG